MENYFDDVRFHIILHHYLQAGNGNEMQAEANSFEFILSGHLKVERSGGTAEITGPGCFWLRKGEIFRFRVPENEKAEHFYFDFSGSRSERMLDELDRVFPEGFFRVQETEKTEALFREMLKLYRSDPVAYHGDLAASAETLLAFALRAKKSVAERNDDPYELEKLAEELRGEPFADYDFPAVAKTREITIDHLRRLFRVRFDCTPREYLGRQRLLRAAEMLRNTHMRVKDIQYTCRFPTAIDFTRAFKKRFGVSPRAYRAGSPE